MRIENQAGVWRCSRGASRWKPRMRWARAGLRMAAALRRFWFTRGHCDEGRRWMRRTLVAAPASANAVRAEVLNGVGVLAWRLSDYAEARASFEESLVLLRELGDERGVGLLVGNLGLVAQTQADRAAAQAYFEESLSLLRRFDEKRGTANALPNLGVCAISDGDYDTARRLTEESLGLFRELGERSITAMALLNLGFAAREAGDYAAARTYLKESLAIRRDLADAWGIASTLSNLGLLAVAEGDDLRGRALLVQGLRACHELGDKALGAECMEDIAFFDHRQGYTAVAKTTATAIAANHPNRAVLIRCLLVCW